MTKMTKNMRFRFIEARVNPYVRFALDEVLMAYAGRTGEPVWILYKMTKPAVSLGRLQNFKQLAALKEEYESGRLTVVRRASSGSSVYHDDVDGGFTWSMILPIRYEPRTPGGASDVASCFAMSLEPIRAGLERVGIGCEIKYVNDVIVRSNGLLIASAAFQKSRDYYGSLAIHGYVAYDPKPDKWRYWLNDPGDILTGVKNVSGARPENVYDAIRDAIMETRVCEPHPLSESEVHAAEKRAAELYRDRDWTLLAIDPSDVWKAPPSLKNMPSCANLHYWKHSGRYHNEAKKTWLCHNCGEPKEGVEWIERNWYCGDCVSHLKLREQGEAKTQPAALAKPA